MRSCAWRDENDSAQQEEAGKCEPDFAPNQSEGRVKPQPGVASVAASSSNMIYDDKNLLDHARNGR